MTNKERLLKLSVRDSKDSGIEDRIFLENWENLRYSQDIAVKIIISLKERSLSIEDLAINTKIKQSKLNKLLSGKTLIDDKIIQKIENTLNINLKVNNFKKK